MTHRIAQQTDHLSQLAQQEGYPVNEDTARKILMLHSQMDEIKACSEKGCRNILKPAVAFSPPIAFWNDKVHAFQHLVRLKSGNYPGMSRSHSYRMATHKNIAHPNTLTLQECLEGLRLAKARVKELRTQADSLRRQFLGSSLQTAIDQNDEEAQRNIRNRMRREYSKLAWRRINRVTRRPPTGRSCLQAEEIVDGRTVTYTDRAGVEGAIQRECEE